MDRHHLCPCVRRTHLMDMLTWCPHRSFCSQSKTHKCTRACEFHSTLIPSMNVTPTPEFLDTSYETIPKFDEFIPNTKPIFSNNGSFEVNSYSGPSLKAIALSCLIPSENLPCPPSCALWLFPLSPISYPVFNRIIQISSLPALCSTNIILHRWSGIRSTTA